MNAICETSLAGVTIQRENWFSFLADHEQDKQQYFIDAESTESNTHIAEVLLSAKVMYICTLGYFSGCKRTFLVQLKAPADLRNEYYVCVCAVFLRST